MSEIQLFRFQNFEVETIRNEAGEVLFRAKSVCNAIGIRNHRQAVSRVAREFRVGVSLIDSIGRPQKQTFLKEAGVWELLGGARIGKNNPHADKIRAFRRWLYADVLPEIRQTGGYARPEPVRLANHVDEFEATIRSCRLFQLEGNQAFLSANSRMKRDFDIDFLATLQLSLPSPGNQAWFTPTELGKQCGEKKSAQRVNLRLQEIGLQSKDGDKWRMTEAGKVHGEYQDSGKRDGRGTPIQVIRWRESVLGLIAEEVVVAV